MCIENAWSASAEALAEWVTKHLVNRVDRHGCYRSDKQIEAVLRVKGKELHKAYTGGTLLKEKLLRHFQASSCTDIIGLHAADENNQTRWGAIDIDAHNGESSRVNEKVALHWFHRIRDLSPLLIDSNGKGGFHLLILLNSKTDASNVHRFLSNLVSNWQALHLPMAPEVFPKQPSAAQTSKQLGNWLRVFGRHYKHDHYSRLYQDGEWLAGQQAVELVLGHLPSMGGSESPWGAMGKMTGADGADGTDGNDGITCQIGPRGILLKSLGQKLYEKIVGVIKRYGPKKPGQREKRGFAVVQKVMSLHRAWSPLEKACFAGLWYDLVKDIVATKDKRDITQHIVRCFDTCRHSGGFDLDDVLEKSQDEPVPLEAQMLEDPSLDRLIKVCSYLQKVDMSKPLFLSCIQAGVIMGVTPMTGWRNLCFLETSLKLLQRIETGSRTGKGGRATTFWYTPLVGRK